MLRFPQGSHFTENTSWPYYFIAQWILPMCLMAGGGCLAIVLTRAGPVWNRRLPLPALNTSYWTANGIYGTNYISTLVFLGILYYISILTDSVQIHCKCTKSPLKTAYKFEDKNCIRINSIPMYSKYRWGYISRHTTTSGLRLGSGVKSC